MENDFLTGVWTYCSFKNDPNDVQDLNTLLVGEGKVTFEAYAESGQVRGQMAFRSTLQRRMMHAYPCLALFRKVIHFHSIF